MSQEVSSADAAASQKAAVPTPLETELGNAPGVGLTLEQIRAVVAKAHNVMLPKDDATLIIATILNAYLTEVDKLQARHEKGLTRLMAEKTDEYVEVVPIVRTGFSGFLACLFPYQAAFKSPSRYQVSGVLPSRLLWGRAWL